MQLIFPYNWHYFATYFSAFALLVLFVILADAEPIVLLLPTISIFGEVTKMQELSVNKETFTIRKLIGKKPVVSLRRRQILPAQLFLF